ncbi:hypothetical protein D3C72_2484060 [compost metagenome]
MIKQQLDYLLLFCATIIEHNGFQQWCPADKICVINVNFGSHKQFTYYLDMPFFTSGGNTDTAETGQTTKVGISR